MTLPPWIVAILIVLPVLSALVGVELGAWLTYAARNAKNPLPSLSVFNRRKAQEPEPARPQPPTLRP